MTKKFFVGMCAAAMVASVGCSKGESGGTTAAAVESYEGAIASTDIKSGADVYATFCEGCHPGGNAGSGPAVSNIAWNAAKMRQQVREGEGSMPGFGAEKITGDNLEALLAHLVTMGAVAP